MSPTDLAQLYAIGVAAAAGWVIPAVVDVVTKSHLADGVKAFLAAALAALAGALATVTITPATHWQTVLVAIGAAFANAMAAHATGYSAPIQRVTANVGIGPADKPADPLADTASAGYGLLELIVVAFFAVLILVVLLRVLS